MTYIDFCEQGFATARIGLPPRLDIAGFPSLVIEDLPERFGVCVHRIDEDRHPAFSKGCWKVRFPLYWIADNDTLLKREDLIIRAQYWQELPIPIALM